MQRSLPVFQAINQTRWISVTRWKLWLKSSQHWDYGFIMYNNFRFFHQYVYNPFLLHAKSVKNISGLWSVWIHIEYNHYYQQFIKTTVFSQGLVNFFKWFTFLECRDHSHSFELWTVYVGLLLLGQIGCQKRVGIKTLHYIFFL